MTREQALPYISVCIDDALAERSIDDMPINARLVGWQCGFEPMFVAVWSYLPDTRLSDEDAESIATDILNERGWFTEAARPPDYVL